MALSLQRQPLKALYLAFDFLGTALVRCPIWLLLSIPKSWRPRPTWSIKDSFLVQLLRHLVALQEKTGHLGFHAEPNHLVCHRGPGVHGVWVDSVPQLIVGDLSIWAHAASVSPVRIPGYWYFKDPSDVRITSPPSPGEKVVYSLHGGSYTSESAHPSGMNANLIRRLMEADNSDTIDRVFAIEYRLSTTKPLVPSNPFPAALIDALAGYYHLTHTIGFAPSNIIIEGDSSGGNLALALTRYLVDYHGHSEIPNLPDIPGALLLFSPWADIGLTHDVPKITAWLVSDYDPEPHRGMDYAKEAFVGPHGMGAADLNEYISPASKHPSLVLDFEDFPRTFISAGGAENLLPQIHLLRDRMVRDLGQDDGTADSEESGRVRYHEAPDASHDCLVVPFGLQERARRDILTAVSDWLSTL